MNADKTRLENADHVIQGNTSFKITRPRVGEILGKSLVESREEQMTNSQADLLENGDKKPERTLQQIRYKPSRGNP